MINYYCDESSNEERGIHLRTPRLTLNQRKKKDEKKKRVSENILYVNYDEINSAEEKNRELSDWKPFPSVSFFIIHHVIIIIIIINSTIIVINIIIIYH